MPRIPAPDTKPSRTALTKGECDPI